ncbi:MAG: hypothetical protein ACI9N1_001463 [Flavobacteriales bacterium]|jgi:hypothetical protein
MKSILITILLCQINLLMFAQGFSDIIKIEGEYYLIAPSLSIKQDTSLNYELYHDVYSERLFIGEYEIVNDTVRLVQVLNERSTCRDSIKLEQPFNAGKVSGNYAIGKVANIERVRRELTYSKSSYPIGTNPNHTYLTFLNGVLVDSSFVHNKGKDGKSYVIIDEYNFKPLIIKFYSEFDDELIYEFKIIRESRFDHMSLEPGRYKVDIREENSDDYTTKYISLKGGMRYMMSMDLSVMNQYDLREYPRNRYFNDEMSLTFIKLACGNSSFSGKSTNEIPSFSIQGGIGLMHYTGNGFFHSIGGYGGFTYSMAFIPKTISISPQLDIQNQHYSYLSYDIGFLTNVHLCRYHGLKRWRPVLEAGVEYSVPLVFRYISRGSSSKFSERWIHKFNDLKVTGRVGFQNGISISGSYRILDVVKYNLPQLPKLQLGFSFPIGDVRVESGSGSSNW